MGLGWEKEWPQGRIDDIRNKYEEFDSPYSTAFTSFKDTHIDNPDA